MTRLLDHLSADYKKIYEFRELSATVTKDLDGLDLEWQRVEDDQFIMTSSEAAVYRREKEFNILPDRSIETLDFRKRRLLARKQTKSPFVLEYLKKLLDGLLGIKQHSINLDILHYYIEVLISIESAPFYIEVEKTLERIVPLNMEMRLFQKMQAGFFLPIGTMAGEEITVYPWRQTVLESFVSVRLGSALQAFDESTIYPRPRTMIETTGTANLGSMFQAFDESTVYPKKGE